MPNLLARTGLLSMMVLCTSLAACSRDSGPGRLPCSQTGSTQCGISCMKDIDCGSGLYCADDHTCAAECVFGGTTCSSTQYCDAHGRCLEGPTGADLAVPTTRTPVCPAGLMCNVPCTSGTTSISGKVYDPAMKNPLFNVSVYVPETALQPLPRGVPTGADACSCGALYKSGAVVSTSTAEDGSFTLKNVPVGSAVPVVIQIGKWRRKFTFNIAACQDHPQTDKSLAFLGTIPAGDTESSLPDIAVSTGSADTLECLMQRIGIPKSEYVAGASPTGHVHVFAGGKTGCGGGGGGGGGGAGCNNIGRPEQNGMAGAPASDTNLWSTQDQLMPYDILLLSCEGGETFNAKPAVLEAYLNAGGRAFGSHFHYSWFSGPLQSTQPYTAPTAWGSNIATWSGGGGMDNGPIGGIIETVLNGTSLPFPKGVSLKQWLTNVGALGQNGVPTGELSIYDPRYNAKVAATHTASQQWITANPASGNGGSTMYLSFGTPVGAPVDADMGTANYCGRAVFSDLHVGAAASDAPPNCSNADLSPQEKALEFMLFDLSACVTSDSAPPPIGVPIL